jgi:hypothetical protein
MGTWPDWIAAIGTSFAFLVAAVAYFRDVKTRRESQARLVYTKLLTIKDHRAGELLEALAEGATQGISSPGVRLVLPEYVGDFVFVNPAGPGAQPGLGTTVTFREASGQWWRRHLAEAIERVPDDPENGLHTPTERDQFAANARLFGGTPTPHPSLTKRVGWHRWWRKKRGRSPIP